MSSNTENHKAKGCEIIVVLFLFFWIGCGITGAILLHKALPAWYGYVVGFIAGMAAVVLLVKLLGLVDRMWNGNGLPPCRRCGSKKRIGTELVDGRATHEVDGHWTMACFQCGERYLKIDRHFFLLDDHDQKHPYMYWKPMRGWVEDTAPENSEKGG